MAEGAHDHRGDSQAALGSLLALILLGVFVFFMFVHDTALLAPSVSE